MKKIILILVIILSCKDILTAQNVGIGTSNPLQKLDVNGNVNISGNIVANGVTGTNGQVLTMNGSSMQWMDKSRFSNGAIYSASGVSSFSVPAGITEVLIEMWGAGGGAHVPGGGGGSGGYWIGLIPVTGIPTITLTIGSGGSAGTGATAGGAGGNTSFSCTGFNVSTGGGGGADSLTSGAGSSIHTFISGNGGDGMVSSSTFPAGFKNYFFLQGNNGTSRTTTFVQTASSVFSTLITGGVGAVAPLSGQSPNQPYTVISTGTETYRGSHSTNALTDFGGGGTAKSENSIGSIATGGKGRVVIYY